MSLFKIDGVALPTIPIGNVKYTENDLQSVGYRDEAGFLHKITVRYGVRKLEVKWNMLTDEEVSLIRSLTKGKEFFRLEYFSDNNNGVIEKAYAGDPSYSLYNVRNGKGMWKDYSISFIEG